MKKRPFPSLRSHTARAQQSAAVGAAASHSSIDTRSLAALLCALCLWASAFAGIRAGLAAYSPGHVALLRFLVASAVLAAHALLTRMRPPAWGDLGHIALAGFLGITVYHVALTFGEVSVTAGAASLLVASVPIITAILSTAFLGERLSRWGWGGTLISFGGVALIVVGEGQGVRFEPGALLIVLAALGTGSYFVLQKPLLRRYSALQLVTWCIWVGTGCMLVFLPGLGVAVRTAAPAATLAIIYMGIFPAALAYVLWSYALSKAPASIVSSFIYVSPVLATLIAWVWLGEVPGILSVAGGVVVLAGVVVVNTRGVRRTAPPSAYPPR